MSYFDQFPALLYTFDDPSLGNFEQVVNLFVRVKMLDAVLNNLSVFYTYPVKDGDTPEIIAAKYYNDPTRHWIVLFANQIIDPYFNWPLNQANFEQNLVDNFGSVANSQATLHHIEKHTNVITTINYQNTVNTYISLVGTDVTTVDGSTNLPNIANPIIQVGANSIVTFPDTSVVDTSVQLLAISNYQYFWDLNETNRNIKLVDSGFINAIESQFKQLVSQ